MLDQQTADSLIALAKRIVGNAPIQFPIPGDSVTAQAVDWDGREQFQFDINRKGTLSVTNKCTYQERYQCTEILIRLDMNGPKHTNPDGNEIPCPHIHIYRQGYSDRWAFPLDTAVFSATDDLVETLQHFFRYCHVAPLPAIQRTLT